MKYYGKDIFCDCLAFLTILMVAILASGGHAGELPHQVTVYVRLEGESAGETFFRKANAPARERRQAVRTRLSEIEKQQAALKPALAAHGAREIFRFRLLVNALQIQIDADKIAAIERLPGVVRVEPAPFYEPATETSVPFIGAPQAWEPTTFGANGTGVRIGIIDTGIDYTHADFGGPGTIEDYNSNDPSVIEPGTFPTAKVAGGWDFAGDFYDAGSPDPGSSTPQPDPDPIDCYGHGTHVAGIAAGCGVLKNGATYNGEYTANLDFAQFRIGPGVAPRATLYALKVFGCAGSTTLAGAALEWAADPDQDGDMSDHIDVVNLSLGAPFGSWAFTEGEIVRTLTALGTVVVGSAGNSGNTFYIIGGVGTAPQAISVANSIDDGISYPALGVSQPPAIAGLYQAVEASFTPPLEQTGPTSGTLVYGSPADACSSLTNAASVDGNIALIDRGACIFTLKILNAQTAGARAVVMVNNVDGPPFAMGGSNPEIHIPAVMVSKADGELMKENLADGVIVEMSNAIRIYRPDLADQIVDSSSRGPVVDNLPKPDISAPGFEIFSADMGTGNMGILNTGTSMSAPHIAGVAALVKNTHPYLDAEGIKALIMNTASPTHDAVGTIHPESRTGAGRTCVDRMLHTQVTAASEDTSGSVSLSFGFLNLCEPAAITRFVRLTNYGDAPTTYDTVISETVTETSVTLKSLEPHIVIPAHDFALVPFQLKAEPLGFSRTPDTTTTNQLGQPRHCLYEVSGQIVFQNPEQPIHLPWYAIVQAASDRHAAQTVIPVAADEDGTTPTEMMIPVDIPLIGTSAHPEPLVSAFQLGALSPNQNSAAQYRAAADLLAVGVASNAPTFGNMADATIFFGIATAADRPNPSFYFGEFDILIDTDGDGTYDYSLFNSDYGSIEISSATDTFISVLKDLKTNKNYVTGPTNVFAADVRDTAPFNTNILVMPVQASLIGLTDAGAEFSYMVKAVAFSQGADILTDTTPRVKFNAARPMVDTTTTGIESTPFHPDNTDSLSVKVDIASLKKNPAAGGMMLLHHMNKSGARLEIIRLVPASPPVSGTLWSLY